MQSMSDGGSPAPATPASSTVPLMVRPEALTATANRLEALAAKLEACLNGNASKLAPQAPGNDEVSLTAALQFQIQLDSANVTIPKAVQNLRDAAENCRVSARQYQQTDDSFGSTAHKA